MHIRIHQDLMYLYLISLNILSTKIHNFCATPPNAADNGMKSSKSHRRLINISDIPRRLLFCRSVKVNSNKNTEKVIILSECLGEFEKTPVPLPIRFYLNQNPWLVYFCKTKCTPSNFYIKSRFCELKSRICKCFPVIIIICNFLARKFTNPRF